MKKLMSVLLAAALMLTAVFAFAACGDTKEAPGTENTESTPVSEDTAEATADTAETLEDGSVFPAALSEAAVYAIPELDYTTWALAGGMADGKELEAADVEKLLETVGGTLLFGFYPNGEAELERADKTYTGTYSTLLDGYALSIDFGELSYYAVMTDVEGTAVLVVSSKSDSTYALYLTQVEVG